MAKLWDRGWPSGCVLCLLSSSVELSLPPNANYMSTVYAPYHGRTSVTDGTMRMTRANGPLPRQRRRPDLETF